MICIGCGAMGYFDDEKNVERYIKMAADHDGNYLITKLSNHLPDGSSVLELGMGPGKDLKLLAARYAVTGSDNSKIFIERYLQEEPTADLLHLDAATIATTRTFDALYSNKVLHYLSRPQLRQSLKRQQQVLHPAGVLLHSFWRGEGSELIDGERYYSWEIEALRAMAEDFEILEMAYYSEMAHDDSIYMLLRKNTR